METLHKYTPEAEPANPSRIHDFLHLSEKELADLKEHVAESNGTIRIFIHPFYYLYRDSERTAAERVVDNKKARMIAGFLGKVLSTEPEGRPPVLIMDEHIEGTDHIDDMKKIYQEILEAGKGEAYLALTDNNVSTPLFDSEDANSEARPNDPGALEAWDRFGDILEVVGAKKVIIAGGEFKIEPTKFDEMEEGLLYFSAPYLVQQFEKDPNNIKHEGYFANYCAGVAAMVLAHRFRVELSNFSAPHSRRDQTRFEHGIKEWDTYENEVAEENEAH